MALPVAPGIDPLVPLAFAVQAGNGAYALLVGSGVSSAAGIKTGWEIVLDLVDKVAALSGADLGTDAEAWYRATFNEEPDYSRVLEKLAPTAAERQALLRGYFEPTEDERERGVKTPTAAHRAIAQLVSRGVFKVIITTNFDRLVETALAEVGIQPYVVRSFVDISGAPSLAQVGCFIVKVHGDYIDERLRNTPAELAVYEPELDALLDRLLTDYGLLITGWSAEWDGALRDAIARNPNRRFTTFWTARRALELRALDLAGNRDAHILMIKDADSFFVRLNEMVGALEDMRERPPASAELAVATAKRYLADPAGRIRLHDLVARETEVAMGVSAEMYSRREESSYKEYEARLRRIDAATVSLTAIAATVGFWGDDTNLAAIVSSIRGLGTFDDAVSGLSHLIALRAYPACLAFYGAALGAVAAGRYASLATLVRIPLIEQGKRRLAASQLVAEAIIDNPAIATFQKSDGLPPSRTPSSDWVRMRIRDAARAILRGDAEFERAYDRTECILALVNGDQSLADSRWFPMGGHVLRAYRRDRGALSDLAQELEEQGGSWPPIAEGLFVSTNRAEELLLAYRQQIAGNPFAHL